LHQCSDREHSLSFHPEELRFIMIDPKVVEMQIYEKLPHLAFPVVTRSEKSVDRLALVKRRNRPAYKIFCARRRA